VKAVSAIPEAFNIIWKVVSAVLEAFNIIWNVVSPFQKLSTLYGM
jgi:hypothetical protein